MSSQYLLKQTDLSTGSADKRLVNSITWACGFRSPQRLLRGGLKLSYLWLAAGGTLLCRKAEREKYDTRMAQVEGTNVELNQTARSAYNVDEICIESSSNSIGWRTMCR